jgi:putative DNA primase/helicase
MHAHPSTPAAGADTPQRDKQRLFLTDMGNAAVFAQMHELQLRYVPGAGWMHYGRGRWRRDDTNGVMTLARSVALSYHKQAELLLEAGERDDYLAMVRWAYATQGLSKLKAMVELASSDQALVARMEEFDADPLSLNTKSGVLHLPSRLLQAPAPHHMCTRQARAAYDFRASSPLWLSTLEKVLPDPAVRDYFQRLIGYCLTGQTSEQVMAVLHGRGSNGKSTLLGAILHALGDYASTVRPELFMEREGDRIPNDLAALPGVRLAVTSEGGKKLQLDEGLVKRITGGDEIQARFLHREWFTFTPQLKVLFLTNHRPIITGTDHGIWRRIHLIPFEVTIGEAERDSELAEKLKAEAAGILAWAVQGYDAWSRLGLNPPEHIRAATRAYRDDMDVVAPFLEQCCVLSAAIKVAKGVLYGAYVDYCEREHEKPLGKRTFSERLRERGTGEGRGTDHVHEWRGIGLRQREKDLKDFNDVISSNSP